MPCKLGTCLGSGLLVAWLWLLAPLDASAQGIAVIKSHDIEPFNQAVAGFVAACSNDIDEYDLRGSSGSGKRVIASMIARKPRLVLAIGSLAAQIVRQRVQNVPIVYSMVPNPRKHGLHGENIVGISLDIPLETQFATYKSLVPTLKALGVIYDPKKTGPLIREAQVAAAKIGLKLVASPATSRKAVPAAMRNIVGKIDALWMVPDDTVITPESFKFLLVTAFENQLPFLAVSDIFVKVGAFASLSPDYDAVGRQACQLVRQVENGRVNLTKDNMFPPDKVNVAINLKTANKIGLTLPKEVIKAASKVFR